MKVTKIADFEPSKVQLDVVDGVVCFEPFRLLTEPMQLGYEVTLNKFGYYKLSLEPLEKADVDSQTLNKVKAFDRAVCDALSKYKKKADEHFHQSMWKSRIGQMFRGAHIQIPLKPKHDVALFESDGTEITMDFGKLPQWLVKGLVVDVIVDVTGMYSFNGKYGLTIAPRGIRKSKVAKPPVGKPRILYAMFEQAYPPVEPDYNDPYYFKVKPESVEDELTSLQLEDWLESDQTEFIFPEDVVLTD